VRYSLRLSRLEIYVDGNCADMPSEPAESNFKDKIHITAYPTAFHGGLIWVYMGSKYLHAELPQLEWTRVPDSHRSVSKWYQETNYLQGYEGDIDSSHGLVPTHLSGSGGFAEQRRQRHRSKTQNAGQSAQNHRE
jgi:phthalate 4,5-dioxygenase